MVYVGTIAILAVYIIFGFNNRFLGRELYGPQLGPRLAHWTGVAIQIGFVAIVTFLFLDWLGSTTAVERWSIGVVWAVGAQAWEVFALRTLKRRHWGEVLAEYNPLTGYGWWLVPLAYLLAPTLLHAWTMGG
jgi:hypothetical protein